MTIALYLLYAIAVAVSSCLTRLYWQKRKQRRSFHRKVKYEELSFIKMITVAFKIYSSRPDPPVALLDLVTGEAKMFEYQGCFICGPWVNVFSPDLMEHVLSSSASLEKSFEYSFLHKWLGLGLLTSFGEKWRTRRKVLTPTLHFRILEDYLPTFNEQSMLLVRKLQSLADKEIVEINPLIMLCTLDIVCETVMGHRLGAQMGENPEYVVALHRLADTFYKRIATPWLWSDFIFNLTKSKRHFDRNLDILHSFTKKVIREKKESFLKQSNDMSNNKEQNELLGKRRKAFMDLLLEMHIQGEQLTEKDIQEEVDTFMFEGHDTIAAGLIFCLYCIGLYPDVQEKIYSEIHDIFGDDVERNISKEDVRDMKYLECTLKESQRLYPSVPIIGRKLNEDLLCNGLKLRKGTTVHCNFYSLHRNPECFPNPEVFDPDRFLPENNFNQNPFSYLPFSAGPRNCIGQKFAMLEQKVVIANVLRNFKIISLDPRDKIQIKIEFTLRTAQPIRLKLVPRK